MQEADIRAIVVETLAEQQRLHYSNIDAVVMKAIATILTSFGIEEEDRRELRADFQHLRRWRKSVEQAQSYTFVANPKWWGKQPSITQIDMTLNVDESTEFARSFAFTGLPFSSMRSTSALFMSPSSARDSTG